MTRVSALDHFFPGTDPCPRTSDLRFFDSGATRLAAQCVAIESILLNCSAWNWSKRSTVPKVRRLLDSTLRAFVDLAIADPPKTSASTFCMPAADRRLFISSSTEAAAASNASFDTLCLGNGEPNRNGSLRGMPKLSFALGGWGAGENKSCTLLEGAGYTFGLQVEPILSCDGASLLGMAKFVSPCFCSIGSSSSTGRTG